jgi:hypothetical protein
VLADGQFAPPVVVVVVVVPQPASVSSASDAAITAPAPLRKSLRERDATAGVCRESMS